MIFNRGKKLKIICSLVILFAIALMPLGGASYSSAHADELLRARAAPSVSAEDYRSLGDTGDITITLEAGQYEIKQIDEYSVIEMEGFGSILNPGEPKLPSKTFLIGLPPGAEAVSVDIVASDYAEIPGEYRTMPAPPIVSGQDNEKVRWEENEEIYSSESAYPSSAYEYLGMGQMRKYNFARVRFSPIVYYPATGKLGLYHSITLRIRYEISQVVRPELLSDTVMDDVASQIITNYPSIKSKYQSAVAPLAVSYNYVIITTDSLQSAVQPLVTWKTAIGYSVNVVTTSWISTNYSGRDLPEKIRNFLIDKYISWGIKYVLIVGSHSTIPMRYCYPDPSTHDDINWQVPSDYYYADLTGDWDSDGDGYYGEMLNYDTGKYDDNPDFYPEVYVGRIPMDDYNIVQRICDKTIQFARDAGSWKQKALLLGAKIDEEGDCSDGFMEHLKETIFNPAGYNVTTMYETSPYECDYPLNHANVLDVWPDGYGIVTWSAHGSQIGAYMLDGDSFIMNSDAGELNDDYPSIVFSTSCNNAWPENPDNLGNSLLGNGAVAFVGAPRISYVQWGGGTWSGSLAIDYDFYRYLLTESQDLGQALYNSKAYCYDNGSWTSGVNMYGFNLYGDPSLGTATIAANNPPNTPSNPSPANHATGVSINADLRWTGGDPDAGDTVTYDVYFGTSSTPPLVSNDQAATTYDPVTLSYNTKYYWKIVATDNHGASTTGPLWDFTTQAPTNNPPNTPSNPSPANHATGVSINADLSWMGGDPDAGDTVTYDVYFGTSSSPPLVSDNQAGTSYDPETLAYNTKYCWKVMATDNHGVTTAGPVWDFSAQAPAAVTWNCPLGGQTLVAPNPGKGRPYLSVAADCAGITASAGAALWGIYYLVETGPQAGTWLWYIPGFVTSTLTQPEPGEYYWVVVSAPCTLTIPQ